MEIPYIHREIYIDNQTTHTMKAKEEERSITTSIGKNQKNFQLVFGYILAQTEGGTNTNLVEKGDLEVAPFPSPEAKRHREKKVVEEKVASTRKSGSVKCSRTSKKKGNASTKYR